MEDVPAVLVTSRDDGLPSTSATPTHPPDSPTYADNGVGANGVDGNDGMRTPAAGVGGTSEELTPVNLESIGESVSPPTVGIVYGTLDAIEDHYVAYAQQLGFGVARVGTGVNIKKEIRNVTWRCSCHGFPDTRRRPRKIASVSYNPPPIDITAKPTVISTGGGSKLSKKVGCKAMVYASISAENTWVIRNVVHEHINHILSPT